MSSVYGEQTVSTECDELCDKLQLCSIAELLSWFIKDKKWKCSFANYLATFKVEELDYIKQFTQVLSNALRLTIETNNRRQKIRSQNIHVFACFVASLCAF